MGAFRVNSGPFEYGARSLLTSSSLQFPAVLATYWQLAYVALVALGTGLAILVPLQRHDGATARLANLSGTRVRSGGRGLGRPLLALDEEVTVQSGPDAAAREADHPGRGAAALVEQVLDDRDRPPLAVGQLLCIDPALLLESPRSLAARGQEVVALRLALQRAGCRR